MPRTCVAAYSATSGGAEVYPADGGCFQPFVAACSEPTYGWYLAVSVGEVVRSTYSGSLPVHGWASVPGYTTPDLETGETNSIVSNGALIGSGDTFAPLGSEGVVLAGSTTR